MYPDCAIAGGSQEDTSRVSMITFLKEGHFRDQNGKYTACLVYVKLD